MLVLLLQVLLLKTFGFGDMKMVSYKELYLKTKKLLKELESNCIDLRDYQEPGHVLAFDKEKWCLINDINFVIVDRKTCS